MAYRHHRRTYTRTILFSETFDFPVPPTWGQDLGTFAPAFPEPEAEYQYRDLDLMTPGAWPLPTVPLKPTNTRPKSIRPMSRATVALPTQDYFDKPLPQSPPNSAEDLVSDYSISATTTAFATPSPAAVSRWSICSDDTVLDSVSRPHSPSSSIHQKLRSIASYTALRSVKSSIKLRTRFSTTLKQLTRRTKSISRR